MIVTVVAVMCKLVVAHATLAPMPDCTDEEVAIEEIVSDSTLAEQISMGSCGVLSQIALADWKGKHPIYGKPQWRIGRIKCVPGGYQKRNAV